MEEIKIIDGEEWVRKSTGSTPKTDDWKAEYDKFCDGDCPRCILFSTSGRDPRPCEIIWLQEYARVPAEKKEEYLVKIKEYIKRERDNAISDAERKRETAISEADGCACALAEVISLVNSITSTKDIPPLVFRMLDLVQETVQARRKITEANERVSLVRKNIKKGKL